MWDQCVIWVIWLLDYSVYLRYSYQHSLEKAVNHTDNYWLYFRFYTLCLALVFQLSSWPLPLLMTSQRDQLDSSPPQFLLQYCLWATPLQSEWTAELKQSLSSFSTSCGNRPRWGGGAASRWWEGEDALGWRWTVLGPWVVWAVRHMCHHGNYTTT